MVMAMNSEYRGTASGVAAKKKSAMKTKTVVTPGTKVSQATIDKIKAMGMTKALKSAGSASPEMREGLKRLYGAKRVSAAAPSKPVASSADAARSAATSGPKYKSADSARSSAKSTKPVAKSADAARAGASKMGSRTVMAKPNAKPAKKSQETTDPFAKFVFGIGKSLSGDRMTAAQVAAENKRRIAAVNKNK
jgi:hypothetical protein